MAGSVTRSAGGKGRPPRQAHRHPGGTPVGPSYADPDPAAGLGLPAAMWLRQPEWIAHVLTIAGPPGPLAAFRDAAAGPGVMAWDHDRLEEDWAHALLAPPPAERGISVAGARILAAQLRQAAEAAQARARALGPAGCVLDLQALLPIPARLLRLGPDDPAVLAWLWEHWGTTWMLREVRLLPSAGPLSAGPLSAGPLSAGMPPPPPLPPGHESVSYQFWSADWTPWRALAAVRQRWPELTLHVNIRAMAE